jgi:hypothetical protein
VGIPNPKGKKITATVGGEPLVLYLKPDELAPLLGTLTPDASGSPVTTTQAVGTHSRKRYIGGPTSQVSGHSRSRVSGDRLAPLTLPGNNAYLERMVGTPPKRKVETITFVGSFAQLKDFCKDKAVVPFILRSPWGEPFQIAEAD